MKAGCSVRIEVARVTVRSSKWCSSCWDMQWG
jgi:hypothetical protein